MKENKKNNSELRMLREIMKYFKPLKKYIIIATFTTIISVLLSMPIPYLNKILVDDVILGKHYSLFGVVMTVWLVILIVQPLLNSFTKYIFSIFDMKFDLEIKTDIFTKILHLPVDFFTNNQLGYIQGRIDNEITNLHSLTAGKILNVLSNIVMLVFGLIMMFFIDWKLTLLTLIIIPINIINSFYFAKRVRGVNKQVSEAWSRQGGKMFEFLMGIETVKLFVFECQSMKAYREKYKEAIGITKRKVKLDLISNFFSSVAAGLCSFIIWGYGGWLIIKGYLSIGAITAFVGYAEYVFSPAIQMAGLKLNLQSVFASWDRIKEILNLEDEKMISDTKEPLQITEGKIEYQNVSFQFEDNEQIILNDITTNIKAGEKVTLAGSNGSGKSTFIKLLVGFFPNYTGTIYIDGQDISKCSIYSIREQITVVSQYVFLFYGSIIDNIRMMN
ncbi:ABC transporter ATP-binding protein [Anaerosporobacter sp.]